MSILVIDSSALITLAVAAGLDLLKVRPHDVRTVREVYTETVEVGVARGLPGAAAIAGLFQDQTIRIQNSQRAERIPGISRTDSLVLHLTESLHAGRCLVNDQTLRNKVLERDLPAWYTAEFVEDLFSQGRISAARRHRLAEAFLFHTRYTPELLHSLMPGGLK